MTRADRLNVYLHGIRRRIRAMDEGGTLFARTQDEWMALARRLLESAASQPDQGALRDALLHATAAVFLATDQEEA